MDKKTALKKVQNGEAEFLGEVHAGKDAWEQEYSYENFIIKVTAVGYDRWIMDDLNLIEVGEL